MWMNLILTNYFGKMYGVYYYEHGALQFDAYPLALRFKPDGSDIIVTAMQMYTLEIGFSEFKTKNTILLEQLKKESDR